MRKGSIQKKQLIFSVVIGCIVFAVLVICLILKLGKEEVPAWPMSMDGTPMFEDGYALRTEQGDGYLTRDGEVYEYCHVLRGIHPNAVAESILLVYTNKETMDFEEASKRVWSSSLINYPKMYIPTVVLEEAEEREYNNSQYISLILSDVTAQGAVMKLHNEANAEVSFGTEYELQVWLNNKWMKMPIIYENCAWNSILYITEAGNVYTEELIWAHQGTLPEGKYRLVKQVFHGNKEYWLAVEFELPASLE